MVECPNCGITVPPDARLCPKCGFVFRSHSRPVPRAIGRQVATVLVGAALVGAGVAFLLR